MRKEAVKRISQVAILVLVPGIAILWNSRRVTMAREVLSESAQKDADVYRMNLLDRMDRKKGLVVGARFPRIALRDAQRRPFLIGNGEPTVIVFANACVSCQGADSWKELSRQFPRSKVCLIFTESQAAVESMAKDSPDPRIRFAADPRGPLHEKFGAEQRRAFVMNAGGIITEKIGPWSNARQFSVLLQQRASRVSRPDRERHARGIIRDEGEKPEKSFAGLFKIRGMMV